MASADSDPPGARRLSSSLRNNSCASRGAPWRRISSADHVITVEAKSPSRNTSTNVSRTGSVTTLQQPAQAGQPPPQPAQPPLQPGQQQACSPAAAPAPRQVAWRQPAAVAAPPAAAGPSSSRDVECGSPADLTEPLLLYDDGGTPGSDERSPASTPLLGSCFSATPPGGRDSGGGGGADDPFPATTAARAAAAEVARLRALRSHASADLRGALAGSQAAAAGAGSGALQRRLAFASGLSWAVNVLLLAAKLYAYWVSSSKAVLASAADSAVDLVSQVVLAYADYAMRTEDPRFPVGQARLEAIGVLACACIMSVASFEVIQASVISLLAGLTTGVLPVLELGPVMYAVLGGAIGLKVVCWAVCAALQAQSDLMLALAEDHLNDVMSNAGAIATALLAGLVHGGWWIDPAGAVAISAYIVVRWLAIAKQQVDKIVGRGAPDEFIAHLEELANSHHDAMGLDVIRAYHFGARYIVEMEVVLPPGMSVRDSHDISLDLQHKVEGLSEVERAFVHVDYTRRDGLEHKVERELAIARALSTGSSGRLGEHSRSGEPGSGGSGSGSSGGSSRCAERPPDAVYAAGFSASAYAAVLRSNGTG